MAAIGDDESDFYGKTGLRDATPQLTGAVPLSAEVGERRLENTPDQVREFDSGVYNTGSTITWGASGIAGVWAEENTRESIYNAFRRKETFATTGTRIKVRFFGGYGFTDETLAAPDMLETAYSEGVSMGSDLLSDGDRAPRFIVWAPQDALSAPLQRLQIIKGWTDGEGQTHDQIYYLALSDDRSVDPETGLPEPVGSTVDLENVSFSNTIGAVQLSAQWTDPDFNSDHAAFYYARVIEIPRPRWSEYDRKAFDREFSEAPRTVQDRAYSSPIWYRP